uniref:Uncharacterized protein n=1 Tax=viral metagenome TaxID=1070528 RepID=A0A6C0J7R1_9ZZZZ
MKITFDDKFDICEYDKRSLTKSLLKNLDKKYLMNLPKIDQIVFKSLCEYISKNFAMSTSKYESIVLAGRLSKLYKNTCINKDLVDLLKQESQNISNIATIHMIYYQDVKDMFKQFILNKEQLYSVNDIIMIISTIFMLHGQEKHLSNNDIAKFSIIPSIQFSDSVHLLERTNIFDKLLEKYLNVDNLKYGDIIYLTASGIHDPQFFFWDGNQIIHPIYDRYKRIPVQFNTFSENYYGHVPMKI